MDEKEMLELKWGTVKGWNLKTEASRAAFNKWAAEGTSMSAMMQRDTLTQKEALCELIDVLDGEIWNDWEDKIMSKEEAKRYVREYER